MVLISVGTCTINAQSKSESESERIYREIIARDENAKDIINSYRDYITEEIAKKRSKISSENYRSLVRYESGLWTQIMQFRQYSSGDYNFYISAKDMLDKYKILMLNQIKYYVDK